MKSDITTLRKYSAQLEIKADLEAQLKAVKAKLDALTAPVLEYFQRQGMNEVGLGTRKLYLRREVHTTKAGGITQEEACGHLVKMGLDEYAGQRVNTQGLSAWVREQLEGGEETKDIEAQFDGVFHITEVFKIGQRKK